MIQDLACFFQKDRDAFYEVNGMEKFRGVRGYYGDNVRNEKAEEQAMLLPVPLSDIFSYVNEFIELIRTENGYTNKTVRCETIELDGTYQLILDNGIIANNLNWEACEYDKKLNRYIFWDKKYDTIKDKFLLANPYDIVWMKFTNKGHLGVVAKSFDINFKDDLSSGVLVNQVGEKWDDSFIFIFPLTTEILKKYTSGDIELAIGNYLISKGVPIIDYYSHNN